MVMISTALGHGQLLNQIDIKKFKIYIKVL